MARSATTADPRRFQAGGRSQVFQNLEAHRAHATQRAHQPMMVRNRCSPHRPDFLYDFWVGAVYASASPSDDALKLLLGDT